MMKKNNHFFYFIPKYLIFGLLLCFNGYSANPPQENDGNDFFYYRSEYRDLLKKKRQSERDFLEAKERFIQDIATVKRENEVLRARLVALEVELYSTKEKNANLSNEAEKKLSEVTDKLEQIEQLKDKYENVIQKLTSEKEELVKKLDNNSEKVNERVLALETIDQLEKDKSKLQEKYDNLNSEYESLKSKNLSKNELSSQPDYDRMILSSNVEKIPTPQEMKALKEENQYLISEIKRITNELELIQRSDKDLLSKKLEEQAEQLQAEYNRKLNQLTVQLARLREREQELSIENSKLKEQLERVSSKTKEELEISLKDEIDSGDMSISQKEGRVIINLYDHITFDTGNSEIKRSASKTLIKLITALNKYRDRKIYIEGNTDNVPIRGGRFKDNWELSTYRALSVLRFILGKTSVPEKNFVAVGNGEFNPIKSNSSEKNKSFNRRVDIVLMPNLKTISLESNN